MEPKPSPPPAVPPRRRGAATKRKERERAASATPGASPPPKRQARESGPVDPPPRSQPAARNSRRKPARKKAQRRSVNPSHVQQQQQEEEEEAPQQPPPPPPRPSPEQEIEAVLSRGAGVHVVPTFAGWFSWKEIHPIEKQMLATFFDAKSEKRTPEIYLGIRNLIMKKFHNNPEVHLESKDLSEISIGEMDARLEILEFLAHWGLVNFHPFPPVVPVRKLIENEIGADTTKETSLVEKLFQFETVNSYLAPVLKKDEVLSPVQFTSFLSEPTLAEGVITSAESSVEYHCNSCSVDCSRKRYHCRTQVDFDLCSDCYNEGKFDEGMSKADFILMESAEVPGAGGSNWTDHEILLLLEALEIFKGKQWDEIAEHVATKTKEQCMLYFLKMPIFDSFLDCEDFDETLQKITEQDAAETGSFDAPEEMDVDGNAEGKESIDGNTSKKTNANSLETGTKLADRNVSVKEDTLNSGDNVVASSTVDESNNSPLMDPANNSADVDASGEQASNFVIDVLRSTFESVDHFLGKEDLGSFAEVGNPVMALAAFLASLVEHDYAVTSCYSSLRTISEVSPALQLAIRHCFILPDPPSSLKDPTSGFSPCTGGECQEGADATQNVNDTDKDGSKREERALALEKENATVTSHKEHLELSNTKEPFAECPQAEVNSDSTKDSDNRTAMLGSIVASDMMRASQEASAESTKDTTNPERVEGDKPSSEELPAVISPSQGKVEPKKMEQAPVASSSIQPHESSQTGNGNAEESNSNKNVAASDDPIIRLQRAAGTAISAAAVKAKFLAEQEEDQIRRLAKFVIEKQFQKMEAKMSFLAEVENLVLRSGQLTDKTRKKLILDRGMIMASRMAAAAAARKNQQGAAGTRPPVGYYALNQQLRHS
ncbi:hypothetical protein BS78_06G008900 [Paspalum vaginatum]|nr:hypothetical protein BS78_06G008900 [Paspalum vaginatum]